MCVLYGKIFTVLWNRSRPKKHATMMTTAQAAEMTLAPVVALTGKIRCKQRSEANATETNMRIKATLTVNPVPLDVEVERRMPTINEKCEANQSLSTSEYTGSDSNRSQTELAKHVTHAADPKGWRSVAFAGWNRIARKSSATPEESDSNEATGEASLTVVSKSSNRAMLRWVGVSQPKQRKQTMRSKSVHRRETQATLRAMLIIIIFVLCWIPFTVMYVVGAVMKEQFSLNPHAIRFIIWLGYANSAMNPLLIFCYNQDFKAAFKAITYSIFCALVRHGRKSRDSAARFEQYRHRRRRAACNT